MTTRRRKTWLVVLTIAYLAAVAAIGFWRTPVDAPIDGTIDAWLIRLHTSGVPAWVDYGLIEVGANVAFFVPLGLLVTLLLPPRSWYLAIPIGVLTSGTIELGQFLFLPARYASWGDIAANSLGTVIGVAIAAGGRLARSRSGREPSNG